MSEFFEKIWIDALGLYEMYWIFKQIEYFPSNSNAYNSQNYVSIPVQYWNIKIIGFIKILLLVLPTIKKLKTYIKYAMSQQSHHIFTLVFSH